MREWGKAHRHLIALVAMLALMAGCATWSAKTEIGQAVQYADLQKQIAVQAMVEVTVLYKQKKLSAEDYTKAKVAYEKWGVSNDALAEGLAAWKAVGDVDNSQKLHVFIARANDIFSAFKAVIEAYGVNINKLTEKILGGKKT